jgi:hypothetical protein
MTEYQVVTKLERIKFIKDDSLSIIDRLYLKKANEGQAFFWKAITSDFFKGNRFAEDLNKEDRKKEFKSIRDKENLIGIFYNAENYDDALREQNNIKNRFKLTHQMKDYLNKFSKSKKWLEKNYKINKKEDSYKHYEKMVNTLALYNIFLTVSIKQKHFEE